MDRFINAIGKCLDDKNWFGALFMALAMPDICGNIMNHNLEKNVFNSKEYYKQWFRDYLSNYYTKDVRGKQVVFMTESDCYVLRCSLLHMGIDNTSKQTDRANKQTDRAKIINKFHFTAKNFHLIKSKDMLMLNVTIFCEDMIKAVREWDKAKEDDEDVQKAKRELLTILSGNIITHIPDVIVGTNHD